MTHIGPNDHFWTYLPELPYYMEYCDRCKKVRNVATLETMTYDEAMSIAKRLPGRDACPACEGSGKVDPHAVLGGEAAGGGVCPICKGTGRVPAKRSEQQPFKLLAEYDNGHYEGLEAIYMPNGTCSCGVQQHHYHCPECGRILQVG